MDVRSNIKDRGKETQENDKADSMARQRKSDGSSEGAREREACEGAATKEASVEAEERLVSVRLFGKEGIRGEDLPVRRDFLSGSYLAYRLFPKLLEFSVTHAFSFLVCDCRFELFGVDLWCRQLLSFLVD